MTLNPQFFNRPAGEVAQTLIGKIIRHKIDKKWLVARIIETEAYEVSDRASHSSLGQSPSRTAMFMAPGTIYMYYARGSDSLNFSVGEPGDAVLIKSAYPVEEQMSPAALGLMHANNPGPQGPRPINRLCAGQTLLCKSLGLKVKDWDGKTLQPNQFELQADHYRPSEIIQCRRLGIPKGRDEHLLHRYVDAAYAKHCTSNPLSKRDWQEGDHYQRLPGP